MRVNTSYRQILSISTPIMLGSAAQNVIALSDGVFLYHLSEEDFASIGFVGVFYLVIAAIGYGFSRGGQIMIARRMGEGRPEEVGRTFHAMLCFELALALVMFLFMRYGCAPIFDWMVASDVIYTKSLEYLEYRSWGVFFSYAGVAIIALYTGVARTVFIIVDTFILALVNILLNYGLIFGKWGLPAMGIAGAGLASTLAEVTALVIFFIYMLQSKRSRLYRLFSMKRILLEQIRLQFVLSAPIVAQAIVGLGSWWVFFAFIENLGERQLAISNLVRMVYLILSIPTWGFSSGVNTLVSNLIGQRKRMAVIPIIRKTAGLAWFITMVIALPVVLFPKIFLYPLFGGEDMSLITDAQPVWYVLLGILTAFAFGGIFFNGLAGTGATLYGLGIQTVGALIYLSYVYTVVYHTRSGLPWAWGAEILYWVFILAVTNWYLHSNQWHGVKV